MRKQKQDFWHFCKYIKKEKLKYHIDIGIQTLSYDTWNSASHMSWSYLTCFYTRGKLHLLDMI